MPLRFRKTRKRRGSRTCGWGQVGQHRGRGHRGGSGYSGKTDVKFMSYYGKVKKDRGFTRKPETTPAKVLNVWELGGFRSSISQTDKGPLLDLSKLGYDKLLGGGEPSINEVTLVVSSWTPTAARKLSNVSCKLEKPVKS